MGLKNKKGEAGAVKYMKASAVFKALGHPSRLLVVDVLSRGEKCVCELTGMVGCDISTMSNHLAVLRHCGLVEIDKRGNQVFYKLRCPCVTEMLECIADKKSGLA